MLEKHQEFRLDQNPYNQDKYDYDDSNSCNYIYSSVSEDCKYYTESHFNNQFHAHCGFSLIHLNARSIKKNMLDVVHVLDSLTLNFDVIAVTETWLESCDVDGYDIDGYKVIYVVRKNKKGGGYSLYVRNLVNFRIIKCLCFTFEDELECAVVELDMGCKNNIAVCCIYRAPGGNLEEFNNKWEDLLNDICKNRKKYIFVVILILIC